MKNLVATLWGQALEQVFKPVVRRAGTFVAGWAATFKVLDPSQIDGVQTAVTILAGIAFDLVLSAHNRKSLKAR